jgi:monoamine oxidase
MKRAAIRQEPPHVPRTADVVVVGAGLAGLAAAMTIARAGLDVRLLEAGDRVGGRVLTLRAPFGEGLYAEAGGEFIAPSHRSVHRFLRAYGLDSHPVSAGPRLLALAGRTVRGDGLADVDDEARDEAERIGRATHDVAARVVNPERPWASPAAVELDARSLGGWLDHLGLDPFARAYQRVWTTVDYGVEAEGLSLLQYARDERLLQDAPEGDAVRVRGGMDRLPAAIAIELGPRVHLATPVTGLTQDGRTVSVRYIEHGEYGLIEAPHAVLAVPLTALRSFDVEPPFEPVRREAIRRLPYSHVLKVFLQFRRRFWRDRGLSGGLFADRPVRAAYEATHGQPGQRGILTVYTAGRVAAELAALPDDRRLARCLEELEQLYSGCRADFELGASTSWDADPLALGAYSYFGPGDLTRYGPVLARPEGRVHFAGEHTDPWQATMNGALASGVRAAEEILAVVNAR